MFKTIALITNNGASELKDTLIAVCECISSRNIEIILDEHSAAILPGTLYKSMSGEELAKACDLAISIGGDGTMLRAANLLANHDDPLLGINRGRLGFLADIPADSLTEHLDQILDGNYVEDERFQLCCEVWRDSEIIVESDAFNDVIIQKGNTARLIELETYVDDKLLHAQRADGMIVASPTGSTAYALSGGGPIIHPSLDALLLVPICPHTLSNRPIVLDGNTRVEVKIGPEQIEMAQLTCDGETICALITGDRVIVYKKDNKMRLIHPSNHDHFSILRAKLRWG